MMPDKFSRLKKSVYNLWEHGFISQFEADSFRMRIDTARRQEKLRKKQKRSLKSTQIPTRQHGTTSSIFDSF
jgi:hypothetical protein